MRIKFQSFSSLIFSMLKSLTYSGLLAPSVSTFSYSREFSLSSLLYPQYFLSISILLPHACVLSCSLSHSTLRFPTLSLSFSLLLSCCLLSHPSLSFLHFLSFFLSLSLFTPLSHSIYITLLQIFSLSLSLIHNRGLCIFNATVKLEPRNSLLI